MRLSFVLMGLSAAEPIRPADPPPEKPLIVGCPGVSFHQVANWVVVRALERKGYTVDVVDNMPHRDMYPKFIAGEIDLVTGTDLPYNHAPWLWNHTDQFAVVGTVNEATDIVLGVPSYAGPASVSELVSAKGDFTTELLSLDEDTCPQCVMMGQDFADSLGFTMRQVTPSEFQSEIQERIGNQEKFVVSWYVPSYLQVLVSGIVNLAGDVEPWNHHNAGKIVVRRDSLEKLDSDTRNLLGALFIGNDAIQQMDVKVNRDGLEPSAVADSWIEENQDLCNSFFGILRNPDAPAPGPSTGPSTTSAPYPTHAIETTPAAGTTPEPGTTRAPYPTPAPETTPAAGTTPEQLPSPEPYTTPAGTTSELGTTLAPYPTFVPKTTPAAGTTPEPGTKHTPYPNPATLAPGTTPAGGTTPEPGTTLAPYPTPAPETTSATCAANAACVAVGLTGNDNCCPTDDGMLLTCCDDHIPSSCAANAGCVEAGLTDNNNCCPTDNGVQLACCDQISVAETAQVGWVQVV